MRLYSAQYEEWIERAASEYAVSIEQLGHTVDKFIVGRRQLAPQVFATTYEDGTTVYVNYGDRPFEESGIRVEPLWYLVVEGKNEGLAG